MKRYGNKRRVYGPRLREKEVLLPETHTGAFGTQHRTCIQGGGSSGLRPVREGQTDKGEARASEDHHEGRRSSERG